MLTRIGPRLIVMDRGYRLRGVALGQDRVHNSLQRYGSESEGYRKSVQKREILAKSLSDMTNMIVTVEKSPLTSEQDDINRIVSRPRCRKSERNSYTTGLIASSTIS
jgi:hypothetical protein